MPQTIQITAGDTEPLEGEVTAKAGAEVTSGDVSSAVLYARKANESSNHVDGASLTVDSVSSTDNGDGTWDVAISWTFDPAGNQNGGGDAFDASGVYECYVLVTYSDGDETRHPGDGRITVRIQDNYE